MGTCLSKKKNSSFSSSSQVAATKPLSVSTPTLQAPAAEVKNSCNNGVTETNLEVETVSELNVKKEDEKTKLQEKQNAVTEDDSQVKKEILIVQHRKSHDDRDKNSKSPISQQNVAQQSDENVSNSSNEAAELMNKVVPESVTLNLGVRTSSCSKEEVDAILIQCGRLSRTASGKGASSSAASGERGRRKYSGSKRSYDFDHCENDTISADDDQRRANATENNDLGEDDEKRRQHRQRHHQSPRKPSSSSQGRRRTPSRERDQNQRSSSRERRVSRSPGKRSSDTNNSTNTGSAIAGNSNNNGGSRPGKMVSVPATVSSVAMDKSNNGGEWAATAGVKRISVKRNVGSDNAMAGSRTAASPARSRSPARGNGGKVFSDNNQQQPSLSRNSSRKAEQSPYRRNPLNEIDPNSLAYPQPANNNGSKVQNKTKKEIETEANQKPNVDLNDNIKNKTNSKTTMEKGVSGNVKTREQQEEEAKILSPLTENVVVKTVVPSGVDNLKPQTLTRSRSSRRSSRDLDHNPEALLNPGPSYTSLLLEDIQNFHQKNITPPSVSLPACVSKACSILEAVADLNPTTSSNLSAAQFPESQFFRNEFNTNTPLGGNNNHGKRGIPESKDPFVESEVVVNDDVMEPSLHKYVTVRRGGSSLRDTDMEDQESSGSNSFTVSSQQQNYGNSSSSWEPNSADSKDCWTSKMNSREENHSQKSKSNGKRRDCDHQHSGGIGRGRLSNANKGIHALPVVTAAAST